MFFQKHLKMGLARIDKEPFKRSSKPTRHVFIFVNITLMDLIDIHFEEENVPFH